MRIMRAVPSVVLPLSVSELPAPTVKVALPPLAEPRNWPIPPPVIEIVALPAVEVSAKSTRPVLLIVAVPALPEFWKVTVPSPVIVDEPAVAVSPAVRPTSTLCPFDTLVVPLPSDPLATASVPPVTDAAPGSVAAFVALPSTKDPALTVVVPV